MSIARHWFSAVLCVLAVLSSAANGAPALPDKPIVAKPQYGTDCNTFGYLEGPEQCGWLEKLGEPVYPVTNVETRIAVRLIWRVGDRGTVITLRYEVLSPEHGLLTAHFNTTGGAVIVEGRADIWTADVKELIAAEVRADIQSLPASLPYPDSVTHAGGIETITTCYSGFTLAEIKPGSQKVVERDCPSGDDRAAILAKVLIRLAQKHFPDIGSNDSWQKVLQ